MNANSDVKIGSIANGQHFVDRLRVLKLGDPMDRATDVGPLATAQILSDLESQVIRAVSSGAKLLTGGRRVQGDALFYEPTALTEIPRDSEIYREEFFGPVALLFRASSAQHAIEIGALVDARGFGDDLGGKRRAFHRNDLRRHPRRDPTDHFNRHA